MLIFSNPPPKISNFSYPMLFRARSFLCTHARPFGPYKRSHQPAHSTRDSTGVFPLFRRIFSSGKIRKNPIFFPGGTGFFLRHFAWSFLCTSASWEFIFSKTTLVRPLWANLIFPSNWGNLEISPDPWSIATGQDTCCNMQEDIYNSNIPHLCAWHNCPFSSIHLGLCQVIL